MLKLSELCTIPSYLKLLKQYNSVLEHYAPFEGGILYPGGSGCSGDVMPDPSHCRLRDGFPHSISGSRNMLEIGFNAGYSALTYLYLNPRSRYLGVDLFLREYTRVGYQLLCEMFPNRVGLIKGSSLDIIPQLIEDYHDIYDVIHIDGGHTFECAYSDLINCASLGSSNTLFILDDAPATEVNQALEKVISEGVYRKHRYSAIYAATAQSYLCKCN